MNQSKKFFTGVRQRAVGLALALLFGGLSGCAQVPALSTAPSAISSTEATVSLQNTYWRLIELDGIAVTMVTGQAREINITLQDKGERFNGFSGCNRMLGGYTLEGTSLQFKGVLGTRMACATERVMARENAVLKMLGSVTGFRIQGGRLALLDGDTVRARFVAVALG